MSNNLRKCIGCSKTFERDRLFRILTKYDTEEVIIFPTNKDFGRSVYICKNKECINNAFKKGRISRYLKHINVEELKEKLKNLLIN